MIKNSNFEEVVHKNARNMVNMTEDTLTEGCTIEDCFPATQYTSFKFEDKTYKLKIQYDISEAKNDERICRID